MRLTAAIIDDENQNIYFLQKLLEDYTNELIEVIGTANTATNAVSLINDTKPNILFLDIRLDIGTSFDVLKKIEPYPYLVVFTTAYQEFALESFQFKAVHYILKPLSIKDVVTAVNRAVKQFQLENFTNASHLESMVNRLREPQQTTQYLEVLGIPEVGSTRFVRHDTVVYCKSDGRYTEIHLTDNETKVSAKNIGKYEELLPPHTFFRIHKSYLVNLNHITQLVKKNGNYCHLSNGDRLPVAKRKLQELSKILHIGIGK